MIAVLSSRYQLWTVSTKLCILTPHGFFRFESGHRHSFLSFPNDMMHSEGGRSLRCRWHRGVVEERKDGGSLRALHDKAVLAF